ncbi:copper chaperone PCu(A)C [Fluviibacterium sp. DFM31]|uniref:Copper chaperone PCu(A)C n=1 Tax=Meridianimarinicoccus marinus TaxID=3231483 RepID=A0ABV3L771_9RHOB
MRSAVLALSMILPAVASAGEIAVRDAWVPLAPPSARAHAAFMVLENTGADPRHLVGVSAPGYGMAHLHESAETDGVATMRAVEQLTLEPGQAVALEHGSFHIMLMMPKTPKAEGDTVDLTLIFADGQEVPVQAPVKKLHAGM